jgi:hypothetical protein
MAGSLPFMSASCAPCHFAFDEAARASRAPRLFVFDDAVRVSPAPRLLVFDQAFGGRLRPEFSAALIPLTGDAGWLWHEHLCDARHITGLTRHADAFVLMRLAADTGMRTSQRALDADAVLWSVQHRPGSFR